WGTAAGFIAAATRVRRDINTGVSPKFRPSSCRVSGRSRHAPVSAVRGSPRFEP
ncbi:MAG: hypothetical protein AVDCRST_MAG45-2610, partial [uncultured Solirubrobacterales bacterium]